MNQSQANYGAHIESAPQLDPPPSATDSRLARSRSGECSLATPGSVRPAVRSDVGKPANHLRQETSSGTWSSAQATGVAR